MDWFGQNKFPLFLAPMARYTDPVYRELCKEQGADLLTTEFLQADSLVRKVPGAWEGADFSEEQRPLGVQIFGSNPDSMAQAARMVFEEKRPDFIDINYGCPAHKVVDCGAGSSMLLNLPAMKKVASAVVEAVPEIPVTAKIRIGWDEQRIVALEAGKRLEDVGIRALCIHGRTKEQGYSGEARWEIIAQVAEALTIPVIGNGNVRTVEDLRHARDVCGCAGAMIGRAALGYPWIFRELKSALHDGKIITPPDLRERWDTLVRLAELVMQRPYHAQSKHNLKWMRPKMISLTKQMPGSKRLRQLLGTVVTFDDLKAARDKHIAEQEALSHTPPAASASS